MKRSDRGAPTPGRLRWRQSIEWRHAQERGIRNAHRANATLPKCGAKRRNGETCKNVVREAGKRCRFHGGLTPSGKNWHKVQFRKSSDPHKIERKLADLERRRQKIRLRVANMTSAERARYDEWHRTHKPGPATDRARARANREMCELLARPAREAAKNPEIIRIEASIAELKALRDRVSATGTAQTSTESEDHD